MKYGVSCCIFEANSHNLVFFYRHPAPFNAYFVAGSDVAFSVTPQTGELLPVDTQGTLIRVQFEPMKYGKIYTGKLVVQVCSRWGLGRGMCAV